MLSLQKMNKFSSELRAKNTEARSHGMLLKDKAAKMRERAEDESDVLELELEIAMLKVRTYT